MEENDYKDFIIADNETTEKVVEDTANPQIEVETDAIETSTEDTINSTETVEVAKEKTETQRVSQRINEARQQGVDEHIAKQGLEWNGKAITTESQYNEAIAESKVIQEEEAEQQRRADLESKGIDPRILDEAIANNPTVKKAQETERRNAEADKVKAIEDLKQKGFTDFFLKFPDAKNEDITPETWIDYNEGHSLVEAYTRQENRELKAKLKVYTQNETNKLKAPGKGVTTHGSDEVASEDDFMAGFNSIH